MDVTRRLSKPPTSYVTQSTSKTNKSQKIKVCQMCFQEGSSSDKKSILSTSALHRFLDDKAVSTPFLYAYLQQLRKKMNCFFICGNCDSWIRRQNSQAGVSAGKKVLLAVDRLILSIMTPGDVVPPEMRVTQRLVATIRQDKGRNWLGSICPPFVVQVICENDILLESRKVLKSISIATWRSGRRQPVLGNAVFAKNIRCSQHDL